MPEVTRHVKTTDTWIIELREDERWVQPCRYSRREFTVETVIAEFETDTIDPSAGARVTLRMRGRRKLKSGNPSADWITESYYPGSQYRGDVPSLLEDAVRSAGLDLELPA